MSIYPLSTCSLSVTRKITVLVWNHVAQGTGHRSCRLLLSVRRLCVLLPSLVPIKIDQKNETGDRINHLGRAYGSTSGMLLLHVSCTAPCCTVRAHFLPSTWGCFVWMIQSSFVFAIYRLSGGEMREPRLDGARGARRRGNTIFFLLDTPVNMGDSWYMHCLSW